MELLRIENMTKLIKKKTIVDNLSIVINPGEIVGFLGPNGAGKTTTIKVVLGLFKKTAGKIKICDIDTDTDFELAMQNVGGIVENPDLYKNLSGRANLKYFASMHEGISDNDIDEVVKLVKMSERIDDKVKNYSLGMRQRVGLAQAILHKPKLLILDEPTNGLDPLGIKELRDLLKYLTKSANAGVFISSHLLSEMELMCDRIYVIDNGVLIGEKTIGTAKKTDDLDTIYNYRISTDDIAKTVSILNKLDVVCDIDEGEIHLVMPRSAIPNLIKSIIAEDILIYAVNQNQRSLEDDFLSMTTGTKTQIR